MASGAAAAVSSDSGAKKAKRKLTESLALKWKFTPAEAEVLVGLYQTGSATTMDEVGFKEHAHRLLGLADETMLERMFKVFDKDGDGHVSLEEWVAGMSTVLRGDWSDLKRLCFAMFDLDSDGYVTKDDIVFFLRDCFVQHDDDDSGDVDEHVKNLAEMTLRKMDHDKDGRLSREDLERSADANPLLLEALGACLPNHKIRF